jgi:hypothetical protein
MPKALVRMGAVTREQMKIVNEAIANGIDEMALYELAMANLEAKQRMLQGTQNEGTIAMQRFHAQVKETGESIGKGLLWAVEKAYGMFQWLAAGALGAAYGIAEMVHWSAELSAWTADKLGLNEKAEAIKKFAASAKMEADALWAAGEELTKRAASNLAGAAEATERASKQEIDAAKKSVETQMAALKITAEKKKQTELETQAQQKLLELLKKGESTGFQTYQDKLKSLEIETELAVKEAEKYKKTTEYGQIIGQIYENRWKREAELTKEEEERIRKLDIEAATAIEAGNKIRASTENWEDALSELPKGYATINGEMRKIDDWAAMRYRREVTSLTNLEMEIAEEKELREIKTSLGWIRPGEAGLAGLEGERRLVQQRLNLENERLKQLREQKAPLADIFAQEHKITALKREQSRLDLSRLKYVSETGTAMEGMASGFKKYITEVGTEFSRMEEVAYNISKTMENAFMTFFDDVLFQGKSFSESMQNLFRSLVENIISELMRVMIVKPLVSSISKIFSPWFGAEGGIVRGFRPLAEIPNFATGAVVSRPTLAVVGEGGEEEYIIPKSKMGNKAQSVIYNFNISAVDAPSFIALCRRNPQGFLQALGEDARRGGVMKSMIRGTQ